MSVKQSCIAFELEQLQFLSGSKYSKQIELIAKRKEFHLLERETAIFGCGEQKNPDYKNILNAAHKLVSHGFHVYILPNPGGVRTPDIILERKSIYKVYDIKTIFGKSSVRNRLLESVDQTNRVLLNMRCQYDSILLSTDIISYFHNYSKALEVVILKGHKILTVKREMALDRKFIINFRKLYEK